MNLQKLNPWNWLKDEDSAANQGSHIPVRRNKASWKTPLTGHFSTQLDRHPVLQLHQQIDRLFDDVFSDFGMPSLLNTYPQQALPAMTSADFYRPQIDISGDEKQYEIVLDAPGLSEEDLAIEVKDDVLTIRGEKEEKHEQDDKEFYRVERSYGSFQRTLSLPTDANADDIQAKLTNGVLTLRIPRSQSEQSDVKRVAISSS
jgi:HSP20 family protein